MDNKEIWKHAGRVATALKKAGLLAGAYSDGRDIVNSTLKDLFKEIPQDDIEMPSDKELRDGLKKLLASRVFTKTIQASEIAQLKDLFGLVDQRADLKIEVIDYNSALEDCPHCGKNLHKGAGVG